MLKRLNISLEISASRLKLIIDIAPSFKCGDFQARPFIQPNRPTNRFACETAIERTAMIPQRVSEYADSITRAWGRSLNAILETGRACSEASDSLDDKHQKLLLKTLGPKLSKSTFSKLSSVGRCHWLHSADIQARLPPRLEHLYEMSRLSDQQREGLLASGKLSPSTSRAEIKAWTRDTTAEPATGSSWTFAWIRVPYAFADNAALNEGLTALEARFDCELKLGEHPEAKAHRLEAARTKRAPPRIKSQKPKLVSGGSKTTPNDGRGAAA